VEAAVQLVLPLFGETAGADDQAALEIAADDELLDEEACHDRLARAGIVGEQEPQRLARQHRLRGDLVGQWIDQRRVDRQHRVEEMRETDPVRLGHEPEERPAKWWVCVKLLSGWLPAPGTSIPYTLGTMRGRRPSRASLRERGERRLDRVAGRR
jgi:hypothetical protein